MKQTSATVADGGSNIIVLRYADVLLMLAECYAEKNNDQKIKRISESYQKNVQVLMRFRLEMSH